MNFFGGFGVIKRSEKWGTDVDMHFDWQTDDLQLQVWLKCLLNNKMIAAQHTVFTCIITPNNAEFETEGANIPIRWHYRAQLETDEDVILNNRRMINASSGHT